MHDFLQVLLIVVLSFALGFITAWAILKGRYDAHRDFDA